ncbi:MULTISPECIES: cell wall metabolism sensor histidine kinase WalK [Actinomadura]|uniref:histidine kinase n=1 Tax=Actinomadura litoris TaxID=2678616 RepID=A0A7K1KSV9_9ACTN|nr:MULTISPECIES: HAMP domain-containing sensor histidine kinase [Actinomadura]MBT2208134.1 HAMP domain-containing protein [Actinomadura sp. NEAU-AAG7]MUN35036.1 HAMP domain-containing protein [Actinomadura litoris]
MATRAPALDPAGPGTARPTWRLGSFWGRTTLRVKLVAGMLVLVTLGMTAMSAASTSVLREYLVTRADDQLRGWVQRSLTQVVPQLQTGRAQIDVRIPSEMNVQIRDEAGRPVQQNSPWGVEGYPRLPKNLDRHLYEPFTVSGGGPGSPWRVLAEPIPGGGVIILGLSMDEIERTVGRLVAIDVIVGLLVLAVLVVLGVWVVRASLRPLRAVEETAGAIAAGDLSRRVPEDDPATEMGRLGRSLNVMLSQIESAFGARAQSEAAARRSEDAARHSEERMRRFVADAGHELRTPLTAIRGFAEFYRQGAARDPADVARLIGRIEETASRMGLLVEDLLLLARLDRERPIERRPVDLLAVAADSVQEARVLAPARTVELSVEGGMAYQVRGDEPRLRQVLGNLLTNAIRHTPEGTPVEVRLSPGTLRGAPAAIVEVADEGPGLSPEQAERVFERFYRADPSRSREDGGTGLGLAIVAALVAAHNGLVEADSTPGEGALFRVVLPLDPD